jgi:hypothetical protein
MVRHESNILEAQAKGIKYIVVEEKNIERNYPRLMESVQKDFSVQESPRSYHSFTRLPSFLHSIVAP